MPAKRKAVAPRGGRGRRLSTAPGEAHQKDWGLVKVVDSLGREYRIARLAMVCRHCGTRYIEFFPSARQENPLIGMVRASMAMGVPERVPTDNVRSVVTRRDMDGRPAWQTDCAAFMGCVGFKAKPRKPRHPLAEGKVERPVKFVRGNFLAGRELTNITGLNAEAPTWRAERGGRCRRALDLAPADGRRAKCLPRSNDLDVDDGVARHPCPRRKIGFDGLVTYEGGRFGVPCWYPGRECRVGREGECPRIYSEDLSRELPARPVTWGRKDGFCEDRCVDARPYELPTAPVRVTVAQPEAPSGNPAFSKFDFEGRP